MTERTAILGGSFDPVHYGHLHLLKCVLSMTSFSRIFVVRAFLSNFKQGAGSVASADDRLQMLRLALEDFNDENPELAAGKQIIIDDREIRKGGVSYTIDTVKSIKQEFGISERIGLIIGDDHLPRLGEWEGFDQLKELVVFLIFRRFGVKTPPPEGAECIFIDNPVFDGSSTEVRDGNREEELLSPRVEAYVRKHALYC